MKVQLPPRRLIPRWRPIAQTLLSSEASPLRQEKSTAPPEPDQVVLEKSISDWQRTPTAGHFGDLLAFSVFPAADPAIRTAIEEARRKGVAMSPAQDSIARLVEARFKDKQSDFGTGNELSFENLRGRLQELRALLRINPANPLALLDYAQLQAANGSYRNAERSLLAARGLLPNNRIVLRSQARFYVHIDRADRAHHILRGARAIRADPWLMASEIAISAVANEESSSLSRGRRVLKEGLLPTSSTTELAAVLAREDLHTGHNKNARGLFRKSMERPNDNVFAQAIDDSRLFGMYVDQSDIGSDRNASSGEARTLLAWRSGLVSDVETNGHIWISEEPFSSRPTQMLSVLYSLTGRYQLAYETARRGLLADPKDAALLTNEAFALAALGKLRESEAVIRSVRNSGAEGREPFLMATEGLIAMKLKQFDRADDLYRSSQLIFENRKENTLSTLCKAYQARAAAESHYEKAAQFKAAAEEAVTKHPSLEAIYLFADPAFLVSADKNLRRVHQWVYDPTSNTLTKRSQVTKAGDPAFVIEPSKQRAE